MTDEVRYCSGGCGTPLPDRKGGRRWCSRRCQKRTLYGARCVDCGAVCDPDSTRCWSCALPARVVWTREALLDAGQRWQTLVNRQILSSDWNPGIMLDPERRGLLQRLLAATGPWPATNTVLNVFGSWNAFIQALGGDPRRPGAHSGRNARTAELRALIDQVAA